MYAASWELVPIVLLKPIIVLLTWIHIGVQVLLHCYHANAYPSKLHTHTYSTLCHLNLSVSLMHIKTQNSCCFCPSLLFTHTNTVTNKCFPFASPFAHILHTEAIALNLSVALQLWERCIFINNFLWLDMGRASPCCCEISGTSCMWLPAKVSLQTCNHIRTRREKTAQHN